MVIILQVAQVAKELKKSEYPEVALQLLKEHDLQLNVMEDPAGYLQIRMEILQILIEKVRISITTF